MSRRSLKYDVSPELLIRLQEELGTDVAIGQQLRISNVAVGRLRQRYGISRFTGDTAETPDDDQDIQPPDQDEVVALYNEGYSIYAISLELRSPYSTVRRVLIDAGVCLRDGLPGLGPDSPNWTGGRYITEAGYVMVYCPDHPSAQAGGYVREHRLTMEQHLGRHLDPDEDVHHRDGNRQNNHVSNLQLISHGDHRRLHAQVQKQSCTLVQPSNQGSATYALEAIVDQPTLAC